MKRYSLRSFKSKPAMESGTDRLVSLGDTIFPIATKDSLENNMGMGMKVLISIMVGIVVGIISKFFSSSSDGDSGTLRTSVNEFDRAIETLQAEIDQFELQKSQMSQTRIKEITEAVWQNQKVQKYLMSNLFEATNDNSGKPNYDLIELTRQLCSYTSMLSLEINGALHINKDAESVSIAMGKFEKSALEEIYPKAVNLCGVLGLSRNIQKDVPSLLQALGELNNALRMENDQISEQQAKDRLMRYVRHNDKLKFEKLTVRTIQSLEKSANDNMDVILANLTSMEKQLEKEGDPEESEYKQAAMFLGQLNSLCGKFLGQVAKISKSAEQLMTVYVSAMKKEAGQEKEINPK